MTDATFELPLLSVERINPGVLMLKIDGASNPMRYQEGQFVAVELPNGEVRSYSLAQPCDPDGVLELHIRPRPGGLMSRWLESGLEPGHTLRVHGPYGDCVWRQAANDESVVMLATGTGIAPLHAMVLRELANYGHAPISLYWGGRTPEDLYLMTHLERLADISPRFTFIPVLSRAEAGWKGARGHVQHVAAERHPDLRNGRVYACGAPAMVSDARALLQSRCGLPETRFLADAFEPAIAAAASADGETVLIRPTCMTADAKW